MKSRVLFLALVLPLLSAPVLRADQEYRILLESESVQWQNADTYVSVVVTRQNGKILPTVLISRKDDPSKNSSYIKTADVSLKIVDSEGNPIPIKPYEMQKVLVQTGGAGGSTANALFVVENEIPPTSLAEVSYAGMTKKLKFKAPQ